MTGAEARRGASIDDHAAVQQYDLVTNSSGEVKVLRGKDDAGTSRRECPKRLTEHDDRFGVECGRCLVDEHKRRSERESGDRAHLAPQPA